MIGQDYLAVTVKISTKKFAPQIYPTKV